MRIETDPNKMREQGEKRQQGQPVRKLGLKHMLGVDEKFKEGSTTGRQCAHGMRVRSERQTSPRQHFVGNENKLGFSFNFDDKPSQELEQGSIIIILVFSCRKYSILSPYHITNDIFYQTIQKRGAKIKNQRKTCNFLYGLFNSVLGTCFTEVL